MNNMMNPMTAGAPPSQQMPPQAMSPQNNMLGQQGAPPQGVPPQGVPPQVASPMPPQGMSPQTRAIDAKQLAEAQKHVQTVLSGLNKLAQLPRGELTKKSVFDSVSTMLAKGAFPTPESKQALIVHLSGLPDDEIALRQMVGKLIFEVNSNGQNLDQFL